MLRIAICDDEVSYVEQILQYIKEYSKGKIKKIEFLEFYSGESLINKIMEGESFDIIYLDIEMDKLDGISTAMKIREVDINVLLIYVSSHESYYKQLFEVEPFRFIMKPINKEKFIDVFGKAIDRLRKIEDYFHFQYNKSIIKLPLKDIMYFDSQIRVINVYTEKRVYSYYDKLDNVEEKIKKRTNFFIRVHKSYLVNYFFIKQWSYSQITLYNDFIIQISEERRKEIRRIYLELIGGINDGT